MVIDKEGEREREREKERAIGRRESGRGKDLSRLAHRLEERVNTELRNPNPQTPTPKKNKKTLDTAPKQATHVRTRRRQKNSEPSAGCLECWSLDAPAKVEEF